MISSIIITNCVRIKISEATYYGFRNFGMKFKVRSYKEPNLEKDLSEGVLILTSHFKRGKKVIL